MTRPGHEGDAFIEFHADTSAIEPEARRGVQKAADDIEDRDLRKIGHDFGETVSKSMGDEFERQGPHLADSIEGGLKRQKVKVKVRAEVDRDNNTFKRAAENIIHDVEDAFDHAGGPGGPFNKIGQGIAEAIGAGFNVSGKSSLIALLIPVVGAIVGLVVAALQAINALIAALGTVPALIGAIGLQVTILMLAFNGVGTAIQGAFKAQNAKELDEALHPLAQSAALVVREIFLARNYFKEIQQIVQQNFFQPLVGVVTKVTNMLGPFLKTGLPQLASALGFLFEKLGLFFASPAFLEFVSRVIPMTIDWLARFTPALLTFLTGITEFSTSALPFLQKLGMLLDGALTQLGEFFSGQAKSKTLKQFFDSMEKTLESTLELFAKLIDFVAVFLDQLDKAGGRQVIDAFSDAFEQLTFFLSTPVGKEALKGLIDLSIKGIEVTTGLLEAILILIATLEFAGQAILAFFEFVGMGIEKGWHFLTDFFTNSSDSTKKFIKRIAGDFGALPGQLVDVATLAAKRIYQSGRAFIQAFIDGLTSMADPLVKAGRWLIGKFSAVFPGSPAKEGPLSGQGYSLYRGQRMVQDFAKGVRSEIPLIQDASKDAVNNIFFGPRAISVEFKGAVPTAEQARQTGMSVGAGINGQLAVRNVQLQVRTL